MTLVRGGRSPFVTDQDAAEFARRKAGLTQYLVPHAGHSIQSDAPLELAAIIRTASQDGPGR
jgi:pimeloyl-ACP methyl ester carboxylesterase